MKKKLLFSKISVCLALLTSCGDENLLIDAKAPANQNTNSNTQDNLSKSCQATSMILKEGSDETKMNYQYNSKGLIEKFDTEAISYRIEYDIQDRPMKLTDLEKPNRYDEIIYDSKGFLSEIRVFGTDDKNRKVGPFVNKITTNTKGEVTKIAYNLSALSMFYGTDPDLNNISKDINFEYDNIGNLKKATTLDNNKKQINLIENTSFDTKQNPFGKQMFPKAFLFEVISLAFFGEDFTYTLSKNNPNQTKITSIFSPEPIQIDYKYDAYNQQGFPEKYVRASKAFSNASRVEWSVVYSCK